MNSPFNGRIEGDAAADAPVSSGSTPVSLLPDSRPEMTPDSAGSFAQTAARMDQMMAEMAARMGALSPSPRADDDDDGSAPVNAPDAIADAQDRLDDLFGSLADRFGVDTTDEAGNEPFDAARDRLDDLAERLDIGSPGPTGSAAPSDPISRGMDRLDDLGASLTGSDQDDGSTIAPDLGQTLLARLFDGNAASTADLDIQDRAAELFDQMDDPSIGPQTFGFDPGRWDDLPDFG